METRDILVILIISLGVLTQIFSLKKELKKPDTSWFQFTLILVGVLSLISYVILTEGPRVGAWFNPRPIEKPINDISGAYSGYIINDLEQKRFGALRISQNENQDEIVFTFWLKDVYKYYGKYIKKEGTVIIDSMGEGLVVNKNGLIIIESIEKNENKWKFTRKE